MRDFAKISCSIWHSRKFRSLPNDDCRLVYLYLHTNQHVNSLGCYMLPFGYAIADLGWNDMKTDPIRYRDCIEALCDSGLIGFDPAESVVRIVDFLKHSPFSNEKHAKGAVKILYHIPDCAEKLILINELRGMKHVYADIIPSIQDRVSDTVSKPCRYTETETETETETRDQEIRRRGIGASAENDLPVHDDAELTYREKLLHAAGIDPRKTITPGPKAPGSELDMIEARKWLNDSRFDGEDEIVQMVASIRSGMRDPPSTLRYFTKPLLALAAAKSASLPASPSEVNHDRQPARDRHEAAAADRLRREIDVAARMRRPSKGDMP